MPSFSVRVEPANLSQIANRIKEEGTKEFQSRVFAQATAISQEIGNLLANTLNNTIVARSLRGSGPVDLPAHLGLDDSTANALMDGMLSIIRTSVSIGGNGNTIQINAVRDEWEQYLGLPGAEYISQPENVTIPVLRWMLLDPTIDIGQAAYDIVFEGEDEKFDARIEKVSRSGRAIMVSLEALGGGGGYVLPSIISGQAGGNFIELAIRQKNIAERVAEIVLKRVR